MILPGFEVPVPNLKNPAVGATMNGMLMLCVVELLLHKDKIVGPPVPDNMTMCLVFSTLIDRVVPTVVHTMNALTGASPELADFFLRKRFDVAEANIDCCDRCRVPRKMEGLKRCARYQGARYCVQSVKRQIGPSTKRIVSKSRDLNRNVSFALLFKRPMQATS